MDAWHNIEVALLGGFSFLNDGVPYSKIVLNSNFFQSYLFFRPINRPWDVVDVVHHKSTFSFALQY